MSDPAPALQHAAVLALHEAVATRLQHPEQQPLQRAVLRKAWLAIHAATAAGRLDIGLGAHDVRVGGQTLPLSGVAPFGPLRRAGIGELRLLADFPAEELGPLVAHLALAASDAEGALAALHADPRIHHVQLLAPARPDAPDDADDGLDWTTLPAPARPDPALQALVARDLASNLPALAARQVLLDLAADAAAPGDGEPAAGDPDDGMLRRLLAHLLARHDLATASWLLAAAADEAAVPRPLVAALQQTAGAAADAPWLDTLLARGRDDDWAALGSFATQLPAEAAARLAGHLTARTDPRARWLRDLLG